MVSLIVSSVVDIRNKSWKPECVGSFNMDWQILVFYPEPEARDKIDYYTVKPVYSGHSTKYCTLVVNKHFSIHLMFLYARL